MHDENLPPHHRTRQPDHPDAEAGGAVMARRKSTRLRPTHGMAYIEEHSIPEPNTGCWLWLGSLERHGYGLVYFSRPRRSTGAHRYSLSVSMGVSLGDLYALHSCDQPSCVNPDHLFPGTAQDNTDDMIRKGRNKHGVPLIGEQAVTAKLTEQQVIEIRRLYVKRSREFNLKSLAEQFSVSLPTIYNVVTRETWRHLP